METERGSDQRPARRFGVGSFTLGVAVGAALTAGVFLLVGDSAQSIMAKTKAGAPAKAKRDDNRDKAIRLVKKTSYIKTVTGGQMLVLAQLIPDTLTCDDHALRMARKSPHAKQFKWSAKKKKDGRYQVSYAYHRHGTHWLVDLKSGRVKEVSGDEAGISRLVKNAPFGAVDGWYDFAYRRGIRISQTSTLTNSSSRSFVRASCGATLVIEFTNGKRKKWSADLSETYYLKPAPTGNSPWMPGGKVECRSTTWPLENVYRSYPIKRAFMWIEVEAADAFGKTFKGAIAETPIPAEKIKQAWEAASKKKKRRRRR